MSLQTERLPRESGSWYNAAPCPGKCAPGETDFAKFIVEGEKRYWLHIALARDPNIDRTVDVLGSQLEEVSE